MDVGFADEGVHPHRLCSLGHELVPLGDDRVVDKFEGLGAEQRDVVADGAPVEVGFFVPLADAHHVTQGAVLLGEVVKPVIVEVAAQPHGGQHQDGPVVHSFPSALGVGVPIDIARHRPKNVIAHLGLHVDVLQCRENGDDFIAAVEVQPQVGDGLAIQPLLAIECFSHSPCSSKIVACLLGIPCLLTHQARKRSHLRGAFFKKPPGKPAQPALWDEH